MALLPSQECEISSKNKKKNLLSFISKQKIACFLSKKKYFTKKLKISFHIKEFSEQKCIQQSLGNRNQSNIPHPCSQGNTILSRTAEKVTFIVMLVLSNILPSIFTFIRPFLKWFLHRFTRLCELQRICYGCTKGASRNKHLEKSLALSKTPSIKNMIREFDEYVEHCSDEEFGLLPARGIAAIMYAKKIKPKIHPDFPKLLGKSIEQIWGYRRLMHVVERLREEQYDAEDQRHEEKLLELWKLLMPEVPLESRVTKQWQDIGFQGDDPKTDFRGMGLLGLENLLYFAKEYNSAARHVLSHSMHPVYGYTFAIVGINLTSMAYKLMKSGRARTHFYNVTSGSCNLDHFHKFYCYLFFEFDKFWIECEPRNIMEFPIIHQTFEESILGSLNNDSTIFKTNFIVEEI